MKFKFKIIICTIIALVLLTIIIPLLMVVIYCCNKNQEVLFFAPLNFGEMVAFYGTILSFLGTVILGAIAVYQNKRLQDMENSALLRDNGCNIYIETEKNNMQLIRLTHDDINVLYEESDINVYFSITNYSSAFLKEIEIDFNGLKFHSNLTLISNQQKVCHIKLPKDYDCGENKHIITFTSCYGVKTYGDFKILMKKPLVAELIQYHFYGMNMPN